MAEDKSQMVPGGNGQPRFPLGFRAITPGAAELLTYPERLALLERHQHGDWGEVSEHDRQENEYSIDKHLRIMSVYSVGGGEKVWVITEADRQTTTILLPDEY